MDELDLLNANEEIKVPFDELQKGTLYPIAQIEKTSSMIEGKVVPGMKVKINHEGLSLFTYLPNKLQKLSPALMDLINKAGETDEPFNVVFYGKIGRQGIGRIHKPGEARNQKLLDDLEKLPISKSPTKRSYDGSGPSGNGSDAKNPRNDYA